MNSTRRVPIFVRSTDYTRTLLSAASLATGLLEAHGAPSSGRPLSLFVEDDEAQDIMHGVGLSSSSKRRADGRAESLREGSCSRAVRLSKQQLAAWQRDEPLWQRLAHVFGPGAHSELTTTGIADALFSRACHDLPPPCTAAGCVDAALAADVWRDAHRFYCKRFAGSEGGQLASRLAMTPLLVELLRRLHDAAAGGRERISIFSGHDTVIAPLIAALGGMRAPQLCRWPPYASRLVFEVWRGAHRRQNSPAPPAHDFVRVLFNGKPITKYLSGCRKLAQGASTLPNEFCLFSSFSSTVDALNAGHAHQCSAVGRSG